MPSQVHREAILNAAIHRDYSVPERTQVNVYPDRVEVVSAGGLPPALSLEQLRQPHRSVPNNSLLADTMTLCGKRKRGAGTTDMIATCRKRQLPEPEFKLRNGCFATILHLAPLPPAPEPEPEPVPAPEPNPGPAPTPPVKPKPRPPKPAPLPKPAPRPKKPKKRKAITPQVLHLLRLLHRYGPMSNSELLKRLGLGDRVNLHKRYLKPALEAGLITPTIPDMPHSRSQQYRLTAKGQTVLTGLGKPV
jgi:predicted HTH transcriptional regulator